MSVWARFGSWSPSSLVSQSTHSLSLVSVYLFISSFVIYTSTFSLKSKENLLTLLENSTQGCASEKQRYLMKVIFWERIHLLFGAQTFSPATTIKTHGQSGSFKSSLTAGLREGEGVLAGLSNSIPYTILTPLPPPIPLANWKLKNEGVSKHKTFQWWDVFIPE